MKKLGARRTVGSKRNGKIMLGNKFEKVLKSDGFQDFFMVGVSGFEPEASWTRTKRDTKLRHTPISLTIIKK